MNLISLFFLAIGLSMDSFAVSLTGGVVMPRFQWKRALKMALFLAIFQGVMPLIGWMAGTAFSSQINQFDHWVSLILLGIIGGKMIYEGFSSKEEEFHSNKDFTNTRLLIGLSIATSIDALAIGVSFALLRIQMLWPTVIIFSVTLLASLLGQGIGSRFGGKLKQKAEIFGGIILVLIGIKIALEHTLLSN